MNYESYWVRRRAADPVCSSFKHTQYDFACNKTRHWIHNPVILGTWKKYALVCRKSDTHCWVPLIRDLTNVGRTFPIRKMIYSFCIGLSVVNTILLMISNSTRKEVHLWTIEQRKFDEPLKTRSVVKLCQQRNTLTSIAIRWILTINTCGIELDCLTEIAVDMSVPVNTSREQNGYWIQTIYNPFRSN